MKKSGERVIYHASDSNPQSVTRCRSLTVPTKPAKNIDPTKSQNLIGRMLLLQYEKSLIQRLERVSNQLISLPTYLKDYVLRTDFLISVKPEVVKFLQLEATKRIL